MRKPPPLLIFVILGAALSLMKMHTQELPGGDCCTYMRVAQNIMAGHGIIGMRGIPETNWTPGYPIVVAILGFLVRDIGVAAILVSIACSVATIILTYKLVKEYFGQNAANIAAFLDRDFQCKSAYLRRTTYGKHVRLRAPDSILRVDCRKLKQPKPMLTVLLGLLLGFNYVVRPEEVSPGVGVDYNVRAGVQMVEDPHLAPDCRRQPGIPYSFVDWIGFVYKQTGRLTISTKSDAWRQFILIADPAREKTWIVQDGSMQPKLRHSL